MNARILRLAVAAALLGSTSMAQAVSITMGGCDGGASGLTTCQTGASVVTFDAGMPVNYVGTAGAGGAVVSGSAGGQYAQPGGAGSDSTPYLSVPGPGAVSNGTVTATLASSANYFGLYWGSMDSYNTLSFLSQGQTIYSVTGADVVAAGVQLGDQTAPGANRYVNFDFGNLTFDQVAFSSSGFAFESDNHAYATVPEPATLGMLGVGLLGVGLLGVAARRRK